MTEAEAPDKETGIPSAVSGSLLASGFPFQTAVADAVRKAEGWQVVAEEWPWQDAGADRFLDVVASKGEVTLAIEAKKSDKDVFTFLSDAPKDKVTDWWRGLVLTQVKDSTARMELDCRTWKAAPTSTIAKFCVVATSKTGDQRLLERDAQLLVRGTRAYGLRIRRTFHPRAGEFDRPFIPVLVTNAELFVAEYERESVSMETGQLRLKETTITPVDWARFAKPFLADRDQDFGDVVVFVVRAPKLTEFLRLIEPSGGSMIGGSVRVPSDRP